MGFISKVIRKAVVREVERRAGSVLLDKAVSPLTKEISVDVAQKRARTREKSTPSDKKYRRLIIQTIPEWHYLFAVYDDPEKIKYYVERTASFTVQNVSLVLKDSGLRNVGKVTGRSSGWQIPSFHQGEPSLSKIEIMGEEIAAIRSDIVSGNVEYSADPLGWIIKRRSSKWGFTVFEDENPILLIRRSKRDGDVFAVDYLDDQYEITGLLIALLLICRGKGW